jgi:hypothetical protein
MEILKFGAWTTVPCSDHRISASSIPMADLDRATKAKETHVSYFDTPSFEADYMGAIQPLTITNGHETPHTEDSVVCRTQFAPVEGRVPPDAMLCFGGNMSAELFCRPIDMIPEGSNGYSMKFETSNQDESLVCEAAAALLAMGNATVDQGPDTVSYDPNPEENTVNPPGSESPSAEWDPLYEDAPLPTERKGPIPPGIQSATPTPLVERVKAVIRNGALLSGSIFSEIELLSKDALDASIASCGFDRNLQSYPATPLLDNQEEVPSFSSVTWRTPQPYMKSERSSSADIWEPQVMLDDEGVCADVPGPAVSRIKENGRRGYERFKRLSSQE